MIPFLLFIPPETKNKKLLLWTFKTATLALNLKHVEVSDKEDPAYETIVIDSSKISSLLLDFNYGSGRFDKYVFNKRGVIENEGTEDELFTAFYLINCLQEYNSPSV